MLISNFKNREHAGILLANTLENFKDTNSVVIGIPRGGIPVAYQIAKTLKLPLDFVLAKKIGHPFNKEYAIGSIAPDVVIIDNPEGISDDYIEKEALRLNHVLQEKEKLFLGNRKHVNIKNKTVILVDDGIATGNTLLASIKTLRKKNPEKIIVAVPVAPKSLIEKMKVITDGFVSLLIPENFEAVGTFYEDFKQEEDEEVIDLLEKASV